jgi:glyoxylase-like metal-dependent hydrolase (beta-lactamase superfamily II)
VVCAEGRASREVAGFLREAGFEAHNLSDGMDGWASVYRATPLTTEGETTVLQYDRPSSGCLSYLVVDGDEAVVVDPLAAFVERYAADADAHDARLTYAVDTHVHADHVSGVTEVAAQTGATAVVPEGARERGSTVDAQTITDGEALAVGSATLTAVHAPGHTTEMTAYHCAGVLFAGDSLFVESVARPDLEAGADGADALAGDLYETLHDRFERFGDETLLAPGHHSETSDRADDGTYTATLGEVRDSLSLLGLDREAFVERIVADMPPRPANFEQIIAINLGTDSVAVEEAFELELGPNNCAATAD